MLNKFSVCFLLILFGNPQPSGDLIQSERYPLIYQFTGREEGFVDKLHPRVLSRLSLAQEKLGVILVGPVEVMIPQSREEFNRWTRGMAPYWAGGIAFSHQRRIVVKTQGFFEPQMPLEVVICHELVHLLVRQITHSNPLPRWLDEGLAQLLADEVRPGSWTLLGRAIISKNLIGLRRVDEVLGFSHPQASLAYLESKLATSSLKDQIGWEGIRALLVKVGEGMEFEQAFREVSGFDYEDWQGAWLERLEKQHQFLILMDIEHLIWVAILLLGVLGVVAVWWRNRRQLKRWEEEETEEVWASPESAGEYPVDNRPIHPH